MDPVVQLNALKATKKVYDDALEELEKYKDSMVKTLHEICQKHDELVEKAKMMKREADALSARSLEVFTEKVDNDRKIKETSKLVHETDLEIAKWTQKEKYAEEKKRVVWEVSDDGIITKTEQTFYIQKKEEVELETENIKEKERAEEPESFDYISDEDERRQFIERLEAEDTSGDYGAKPKKRKNNKKRIIRRK
jgi:hypothetical protein